MKKTLLIIATIFMLACAEDEKGKGDILFGQRKYQEAIKAYNEYLELHPSHVKSLYNRGRSFEELKEFDKAAADFTRVLEIDKKNTSALLSMAEHNYRIENYDQARYFAETAVKVNGELAQGFFWLGRAEHRLGKFNEALSAYNNAINLDRDLGEAYMFRGAIKMSGDRKKGACADFKMAKSLKVKEADAVINKYCK